MLQGGPLLIGHRGAAGLAPENTMLSFREAVGRWQVDMVELDVHASADGHCVVIHDPTVDRTTDGSGAVAEKTLAQLQALDAGYRFEDEDGELSYRGRGATIPTLEEVLSAFPDTRFTLEVKAAAAQEPMFETVRRLDAKDRVIAAGIHREDRTLFDQFDGAISGDNRTTVWFYIFHRLHLAWLWPRRVDVFQVPERHEGRQVLSPRFVRDARRRGVPVHVWTVNEATTMERLLEWGVDGLITDRPDRAARVLAEQRARPLPPALR